MQKKSSARYETHPYLQKRWKNVGRRLAFNAQNVAAWKKWRRELTATLKEITGYTTMLRSPLKPKIAERLDLGDHYRERVEIQTEPGIIMPMYVLVPKGEPPFPAILAPHGHGGGGKLTVAGCGDTPQLAEAIKNFRYDYGVQFVRAGMIAFCPDARGFGERQERAVKGDILRQSCREINNMALPLGQTVTGMWAWDLHRLIDYVETRPDCRKGRLACAGLSGGGLQTLWATALDERITCAVVSGYFYGYKEALLDLYENCSCNYVPHLYEYCDMGDIAALIAPRPLLIETGTRDSLNGAGGISNVLSQLAIVRRAYRLLNARANIKHDVFEGEHRWNGEQALPWLQRNLLGAARRN